MTFQEIKNKAAYEQKYIIEAEITTIKNSIIQHPSGQDLRMPKDKIPAIIVYCDSHNIPVYHVNGDCISAASTYSKLVLHESIR